MAESAIRLLGRPAFEEIRGPALLDDEAVLLGRGRVDLPQQRVQRVHLVRREGREDPEARLADLVDRGDRRVKGRGRPGAVAEGLEVSAGERGPQVTCGRLAQED